MSARVSLAEAAEFLRSRDDYLILSHRRPDGDTVGSCAALCLALRAVGKRAWVYPNPQFTPKFAPYLETLVFEATGNRQQATEKAFPLRGRWHPASPASRMTDEVVSDAHGNGRERIATASVRTGLAMTGLKRFRVLAARNVHKTFLSAAALLDLDVRWLPRGEDSYLSARVTPEALAAALRETGANAVYLTCPDYLGDLPDLRPLAEVCHAHGALLLVDNAHGAYLRFLTPSRHPMDLGADLCCLW